MNADRAPVPVRGPSAEVVVSLRDVVDLADLVQVPGLAFDAVLELLAELEAMLDEPDLARAARNVARAGKQAADVRAALDYRDPIAQAGAIVRLQRRAAAAEGGGSR